MRVQALLIVCGFAIGACRVSERSSESGDLAVLDLASPDFSEPPLPSPDLAQFDLNPISNTGVKCEWNDPSLHGATTTPLVADLDGDGKPEIIFLGFPDKFIAVHGNDCSIYFAKTFKFGGINCDNITQLAIGDLDDDGSPEIVGVSYDYRVVVFDRTGNLLATSPVDYVVDDTYGDCSGGPALADLDGVSPAEIVAGGQALRYVKGNSNLEVLWAEDIPAPYPGALSIVADLDDDGSVEVISGTQILDGKTGIDITPAALTGLGMEGAYSAVVDFNSDSGADLVFVGGGKVAVFDWTNKTFLLGPVAFPGPASPPTVADFDGDGEIEIGINGANGYYVFKPSCADVPKPAACDPTTNIGILWKKSFPGEEGGMVGSTVFDLDGDSKPEAIVESGCWLRILNGSNGSTEFAFPLTQALSGLALPIVADVDGDGHADIVAPSSDNNPGFSCPGLPDPETGTPWAGSSHGLSVFRDPLNRWVPARGVWNQQSYHVTNIRDDLSIPVPEPASWRANNSYRQNLATSVAPPN